MRKALLASVTGTALLGLGAPAMADSLTPAACPGGVCAGFSGTITVGGSTSITNKVGIITAGSPTSAQADVLFISDTTGSMSSAIAQVKSTFGDVVTNLAGSITNLATGAAQYRDGISSSPNFDGGDFTYSLSSAINTNSANTQAGINTWSAGGGGDEPEQALYALSQAASNASTGWRAGSKKIAVIVGDAPSHSSPGHGIAAGGASVTSAAAALTAEGVTVESLNAGNLTGDSLGLDGFGQFDASGSGSIYGNGVSGSFTSSMPSGSALTAELEALIGSAFATYTDVSLDLVSSSGPCSVGLPGDITGSFSRATTNTFGFGAVTITGTGTGTCNMTIALEADGAILAEENDTVNVVAAPEPATIAVLGAGLFGLGAVIRRRRRD